MKSARYLHQNSTQTLRQAISELRGLEVENDAAETLAPELSNDVAVHDVIHVMFGCQTGLEDEVIAHVWTALGTTYLSKDMVRVNLHSDHREVLRSTGHLRLLLIWLKQIPRIGKAAFRARRMKDRFPVEQIEAFWDRPLNDLRNEFGIRVLDTEGESQRSGGAGIRGNRTAQQT